jgi:hypothetical protein
MTVHDSVGTQVAAIDTLGNLFLAGTLTQGTPPAPDFSASEFLVRVVGAPLLLIDDSGNAVLAGSCYQEESSLSPPVRSFVVKNDADEVIAYVDPSGDLHLTGELFEFVTE